MADSLEENYLLDDVPSTKISSTKSQALVKSSSSGASAKASSSSLKRPAPSGNDDASDNDEDLTETTRAMKEAAGASTAEKKAKRKARQAARKARLAAEGESSNAASSSAALFPVDLQADYLRKAMRKTPAWKDLSEMEVSERAVPESFLVESNTSWREKDRELEDMADFLKHHVDALKSIDETTATDKTGSPTVLVLTNNALRAAHLAQELRKLLPGWTPESSSNARPTKKTKRTADPPSQEQEEEASKSSISAARLQIAKLFSRHFSPAEQVAFLSTHPVLAAAGTPQRVAVLLERKKDAESGQNNKKKGKKNGSSKNAEEEAEDKPTSGKKTTFEDDAPSPPAQNDTTLISSENLPFALDISSLKAIILDVTWRDEKNRTLLDDQGAREGWTSVWDIIRSRRRQPGAGGEEQIKVILY